MSQSEPSNEVNQTPAQPVRRRLPEEREAITHKFDISGYEGYVTVGLYSDGTPGEIFVVMAKEGSTISGFADAWAQAMSLALQYGVPLEVLVEKFSHVRFQPSGVTKNPDVRFAKSVVDYIVRWMAGKFLNQTVLPLRVVTSSEGPAPLSLGESLPRLPEDDAPPCATCGSIMVRQGAGFRCQNCGNTAGYA